jgi:hypothetical protein
MMNGLNNGSTINILILDKMLSPDACDWNLCSSCFSRQHIANCDHFCIVYNLTAIH